MYKEDELKMGQGGDTPLCPFDCDCCNLSKAKNAKCRFLMPARNVQGGADRDLWNVSSYCS